jgi:hypothetical protein
LFDRRTWRHPGRLALLLVISALPPALVFFITLPGRFSAWILAALVNNQFLLEIY